MRKAFSRQQRLDCPGVLSVQVNLECRDELIPILRSLQHVYSQAELRETILDLVALDVNQDARDDTGRTGMDYWQILVLASVRQGCNLNYDKLQDLAEQHRNLRAIMGIGDWNDQDAFSWRRIRDNICHLKPATIDKISQAIVSAGHGFCPDAPRTCRADSFVMETNIHWPTESTLLRDGLRIILKLAPPLAATVGMPGWRQADHLDNRIRKLSQRIERIASIKGPNYVARLKVHYRRLLKLSGKIAGRAARLLAHLDVDHPQLADSRPVAKLRVFLQRTEQVRETARRRVIAGEQVPNDQKLFSMFEPHTQLYKRRKAGEPIQFGRQVLIFEDGAGFITHSYLLGRQERDEEVIAPQTRIVQERLKGAIEEASFDRGFHNPANQRELAKIVAHPCLPVRGAKQSTRQEREATIRFRRARQRHAGVESAIGALQSGNGLKRARDHSEIGFARCISLAVLGRNLHTLGKLLIAREAANSQAARSKRSAGAA